MYRIFYSFKQLYLYILQVLKCYMIFRNNYNHIMNMYQIFLVLSNYIYILQVHINNISNYRENEYFEGKKITRIHG